MKPVDREVLHDVALHLPGGACLGLGAIAAVTGHPAGLELSNIGIAYIGLLMAYHHVTTKRRQDRDARADAAALHAGILRPEPETVGTIVSARFIRENDPARAEQLDAILRAVPHLSALDVAQKQAIGYPTQATVFATNQSVLAIDVGAEGELPDLVVASARGTTLRNETGALIPFVKPAAIRIALALDQYRDQPSAVATWDHVYHDTRGARAIVEAYRVADHRLGAIVADGPIGLQGRKGTVVNYGDYRYLGFDAVSDVGTKAQAENVAQAIAERGVYDVDKQHWIHLHSYEIRNLSAVIYRKAQEYSLGRKPVGLSR